MKPLKIKPTLLILAIAAAAVSASAAFFILQPQQEGIDKLVIAVQPTQNPVEIKSRAEQLRLFLEERLDLPVEIYVPTNYAAVVEALRFRNAHLALMGSWPAYIATSKADSEVILAEVRTVAIDGKVVEETYYFSYWIVLKDSPYQSLQELRGRKACFPSPLSSSGYLAPLAKLVELGLVKVEEGKPADPESFFGEAVFGGGYGQCWAALKAGQVDVAVIAGDVAYDLYKEAIDNSRVLEKQGPLPSHVVVAVKDLPEELKQRIKLAFTELGREEYRDMMKRLVSAIFVGFRESTTEEHLGSLSKFIEMTGLEFT
ncbi:MAG TPA: phosphate/phosphite/phosphonate ABC transporter substrate-binding protein [Candidatus Caldiarchaeum subterraneum]|uniref:Phosphate/phosphite/phosphonate ABC transporter substrate-binding protein n=1 Tax=Caldiarchaeum subterraneum TaxID=311458 RepID=A0A833EA86_CALS0|nr:phosphate/phosphite/phosphonate ABC transporter substrate-binding protein [Aigarchaeota archaeon]HIQ29490.1 phosphate/phosphite/phosphonate ABC transporter substrate-binding protein [Candidatus Caldarchaeum subterraneum]